MDSDKNRFFIETDMFSELSTRISEVPEIKKYIKYNKADVYADISEEELEEIMCDYHEPVSNEEKRKAFIRDFYAVIQKESGPIPAKDFYNKVKDDPSFYFKDEPNSLFFTSKPIVERESIMDEYGVWMIGKEDLNDTFLESYDDDYEPGSRFGENIDGWANIREKVGKFPSSSMIVIDNFIASWDSRVNELCGLANLKSIIDNFVSDRLLIDSYNILIVTQQKSVCQNLKRDIIRWINSVKLTHPKVKIQFLLTRQTPEHDRWIFFNYGSFECGKGFRIFEPSSNIVHYDGNKPYHFTASKYISQCSLSGKTPLQRAQSILNEVWKLYHSDDGTIIIGDKIMDFSISR